MSDYVSMRSINLKNTLMTPQVLQAYRSGNLDYNTLQTEDSPLQEIYSKTYQYINYPELSDEAKNLIALTKPVDITRPIPNNVQLAQNIAKLAVNRKG
jgi:hypothetical protein